MPRKDPHTGQVNDYSSFSSATRALIFFPPFKKRKLVAQHPVCIRSIQTGGPMSSSATGETSQVTHHIVIVPISGWSHLRLILRFTLDLLTLHPSLVITFLITSLALPRLQREIDLHPATVIKSLESRFRIFEKDDGVVPGSGPRAEVLGFEKIAGEAITEILKGGEGRFGTRPCAFILDVSPANIRDMSDDVASEALSYARTTGREGGHRSAIDSQDSSTCVPADHGCGVLPVRHRLSPFVDDTC